MPGSNCLPGIWKANKLSAIPITIEITDHLMFGLLSTIWIPDHVRTKNKFFIWGWMAELLFHELIPLFIKMVLFSGDIQSTLNEDQSRLVHLVTQLRYWITKQRVQKTLQQLPATPYESLPILFDLVSFLFIAEVMFKHCCVQRPYFSRRNFNWPLWLTKIFQCFFFFLVRLTTLWKISGPTRCTSGYIDSPTRFLS